MLPIFMTITSMIIVENLYNKKKIHHIRIFFMVDFYELSFIRVKPAFTNLIF